MTESKVAPMNVGQSFPHLSEEIWEQILFSAAGRLQSDVYRRNSSWTDESKGDTGRIRLTCSLFARILRSEVFRSCTAKRTQLQYLFDHPSDGQYVREWSLDGRELVLEPLPNGWIVANPQRYGLLLKEHLTRMICLSSDLNEMWKETYLRKVEDGYDDAMILAHILLCPNITSINVMDYKDGPSFFPMILDHIFAIKYRPLQHVTWIDYQHCESDGTSSFRDVQPVVLLCPALQTLILTLIRDFIPKGSAVPLQASPKTNPSVRNVILRDSHFDAEDLENLLIICPNLRHLEMDWAAGVDLNVRSEEDGEDLDVWSIEGKKAFLRAIAASLCRSGTHLETLILMTHGVIENYNYEALDYAGDLTPLTYLKRFRVDTHHPLDPLIKQLQGQCHSSVNDPNPYVWNVDAYKSILPKNLQQLILIGKRRIKYTERPLHLHHLLEDVEIKDDPGYMNVAMALIINVSEQGNKWEFGNIEYPL